MQYIYHKRLLPSQPVHDLTQFLRTYDDTGQYPLSFQMLQLFKKNYYIFEADNLLQKFNLKQKIFHNLNIL